MWPILLIAGAVYLFGKQVSTAINQVEIIPRGVKFQRSGVTINLLYTFDIYNPADVAATIDAVSGRILSGTTQLGTFITRQPISIQPRSTTTSTAAVRIDSFTALRQLYQVWVSGKTPTITIQGQLQTKLATIPYTYTVYVGQDLGLKKAGVTGIGATKKNKKSLAGVSKGLRVVKVYYNNGDSITTSMAEHLSDSEILNYFKIGKVFNIGNGRGGDLLAAVEKVEILN